MELPGLEKYQLDRIELDNHGIVEDCQKAMVSEWLHTGVATWRGLVQALTSPLVNRRDLAIEIAKQHQICEKKRTNRGEGHFWFRGYIYKLMQLCKSR